MGKTSQRVAKQLFQQGHQITTVSRSAKEDDFAVTFNPGYSPTGFVAGF